MVTTIKDQFDKYLEEVLTSKDEILKYSNNQLVIGFITEKRPEELSRMMEPAEDWDREQVELYDECYKYVVEIRKDL